MDFWGLKCNFCHSSPDDSIFHGPEVERNFSLLAQTLNPHTARLNVETVNSILTIKYFLRAENTTSCIKFYRNDIVLDPIPKALMQKMQNAWKERNQENEVKSKRQAELKALSSKPEKPLSRTDKNRIIMEAAKKAQKRHMASNLDALQKRKRCL